MDYGDKTCSGSTATRRGITPPCPVRRRVSSRATGGKGHGFERYPNDNKEGGSETRQTKLGTYGQDLLDSDDTDHQ